MARDLVYYYDYKNPASGNRERFILRPGYDLMRTLDTPPAFGATGNATWIQLPAGFLKSQSSSDFGYDALPMGMPDPATRTFRFDLMLLFEAGDSDLQDVSHYLTDDPTVNRLFNLNTAVEPLTATFDTTNVFTVLSDLGNASLGVGSFAVKFIGVQERSIARPMKIRAGEAIIDVTAIDLLRAAATVLTPQHLYDHIVGTEYDVITKRYVYSTVYNSGTGRWYLHCYGTPGGGAYQVHWAYYMSDLWVALQWLLQQVMRAMLGDEAFEFFFDSDGATVSDAGPTSLLALYDQSYEADGEDGGDEVTDDVMFIGLVRRSDDSLAIGGWFHPDEPQGAFRYKTVWDMLKDACEGHCARARLLMEQDQIVVMFYSLEFEVATTLTVEPPAEGNQQEPAPGEEVIVRAESDISDATGADVGHMEYQIAGTQEDDGRTIPRWFHCQPFVGSEGEVSAGETDVVYILQYTGDAEWDGIFPGPTVGILQLTWPVNTMVYVATGLIDTEEILIRCHHRVKIFTGNLVTPVADDCSNTITPGLPTALDPDDVAEGGGTTESLRREQIRDGFWRKYRLSMIATQKTSGVQFAVCQLTVRLWSRWTQYGVTLTVPAAEVPPDALGCRADLDLPAWLNMGDFFDGYDSKAFLVNIAEDAAKDTAAVTLIAPGVA